MKPTICDPVHRTINTAAECGSEKDWIKPERAVPGTENLAKILKTEEIITRFVVEIKFILFSLTIGYARPAITKYSK